MQELLEQHCLDEKAKGLLLLSTPTGFGKTYNVLNFIYKNYKDFAAQKRKIFFITNLKKNLPYQELKERFKADNAEDDYYKHVLFIDSNAETVIAHLLSIDSQIPDSFKTGSYTRLRSYIETLTTNGKLPKAVKKVLNEEISNVLEPRFRKSISSQLRQEFKTKKRGWMRSKIILIINGLATYILLFLLMRKQLSFSVWISLFARTLPL